MLDTRTSDVAIMSTNPVATSPVTTAPTTVPIHIHVIHTIDDDSDSDKISDYMSVKSDDDTDCARKKLKLNDSGPSCQQQQQPVGNNIPQNSELNTRTSMCSSTNFNKVPQFKFGPFIPILRKQDEIVIDPNGIVDYYKTTNETNVARCLAYEILPDDSIVDAPSLVTPLLLKKKTNWPPRINNDQSSESGALQSNSTDPVEINLDIPADSDIQVIKIVKKTPQITPKVRTSNTKDIESYIKSTAVASLINTKLPSEPILTIEDYYKTSASDMLYNIGLNQVSEFNLADRIKKLASRIRRSREKDNCDTQIQELEESRKQRSGLKSLNSAFRPVKYYSCQQCLFRCTSLQVLELHLETPHFVRKEYSCNWCEFKHKDFNQVSFHNLVQHKKRCRFVRPLSQHFCNYCSYECSSKKRMTTHIAKCEQCFPHTTFQGPKDYEEEGYPGVTSKLITHEDILTYENALKNLRLAAYNPHQITVSGIKPAGATQVPILVVSRPRSAAQSTTPSTSNANAPQLNPFECFVQKNVNTTKTDTNGLQVLNSSVPIVNQVGNNQVHIINHNRGKHLPKIILIRKKQNSICKEINNVNNSLTNHPALIYSTGPNNSTQLLNLLSANHSPSRQNNTSPLQSPRTQSPFVNGKSVLKNASEIVMTPQARPHTQKQDSQVINLEDDEDESGSSQDQVVSCDSPKGSTFVICEICDGYIKDLSQLRVHMQWIHKVSIYLILFTSNRM